MASELAAVLLPRVRRKSRSGSCAAEVEEMGGGGGTDEWDERMANRDDRLKITPSALKGGCTEEANQTFAMLQGAVASSSCIRT